MKHIVIDIDGCITNGKGQPTSPSLLAPLFHLSKHKNPSIFLCTGRSAPYVEAIAQILNINQWCICENGAYLYHPFTDEVMYHPLVTVKTIEALQNFQERLQQDRYKECCRQELGKHICVSLNPINTSIETLFQEISKEIDHKLLCVNHSTTAVDITPQGVDKGSALKFLAQAERFELNDVIAIGDSSGDIPFMQISGKKGCPSNAIKSVKTISDYTSPLPSTEGVSDIIQHFLEKDV